MSTVPRDREPGPAAGTPPPRRVDRDARLAVDAFLDEPDRDVLLAGELLAVCIDASDDDLASLLGHVAATLGRRLARPASDAVADLAAWPIVVGASDRRHVPDGVSQILVGRLAQTDPAALGSASGWLALREERAAAALAEAARAGDGSGPADEETWYATGRTAYYTAASDPGESGRRFREAFVSAPWRVRGRARRWLAGLAVRQAPLLAASQPRDVAFFDAFRTYSDGRRALAHRMFGELVLDADGTDVAQAVGLHLWARSAPRLGTRENVAALRSSVRMSRDLGLVENELMARNTLVWALRALGPDGGVESPARTAADTAARNAARARDVLRDGTTSRRLAEVLVAWTQVTDASARWNAARGSARDSDLAAGVLDQLLDVVSSSRKTEDWQTTLHALGHLAVVYADLGRDEDSLACIDEALDLTVRPADLGSTVRTTLRTAGASLGSRGHLTPTTETRLRELVPA